MTVSDKERYEVSARLREVYTCEEEIRLLHVVCVMHLVTYLVKNFVKSVLIVEKQNM